MLKYLSKSKMFEKPRLWFVKKLRQKRISFTFYWDYRKDIYDKLLEIHESEIWGGGSVSEAYNLYQLVRQTNKLQGDIAEVGVGKGGHSTVICEAMIWAREPKSLYLFDSFEGFPKDINKEEMKWIEDNCNQTYDSHKTNVKEVRKHFSQYKNVFIYKGWFPKTATSIKNKKFCFVNLDVNIYDSQIDCLEFFYPRMVKGGIIITHDYTISPSVRKATDDFFEHKPEVIIELNGSHAIIVKV